MEDNETDNRWAYIGIPYHLKCYLKKLEKTDNLIELSEDLKPSRYSMGQRGEIHVSRTKCIKCKKKGLWFPKQSKLPLCDLVCKNCNHKYEVKTVPKNKNSFIIHENCLRFIMYLKKNRKSRYWKYVPTLVVWKPGCKLSYYTPQQFVKLVGNYKGSINIKNEIQCFL